MDGVGDDPDDLEPCFLTFWCEMYGLTSRTTKQMHNNGITTGDIILSLQQADINSLDISLGQKCLLRGAILQYRECRTKVDRIILSKSFDPGVIAYTTRRILDVERVKALDSMERLPITVSQAEQTEYRQALRRKSPHSSRQMDNLHDGRSLAERILQQRLEMQQDRSYSVPLNQELLPSPTRSVSSAYSSPANINPDAHQTLPSNDVTNKKTKKLRRKKTEELKIDQDVQEILESISSPDESKNDSTKQEKKKKKSKKQSKQKAISTTDVVKNLEDNLFTEEELAIIDSIKAGENKDPEENEKKKKDKKNKKKNKSKYDVEKSIKDEELDKMITGDFETELDKVLSKTEVKS